MPPASVISLTIKSASWVSLPSPLAEQPRSLTTTLAPLLANSRA